MDDFFAPGGLLSERLTGYEPRHSQARMARIVADALAEGHHAVIEAGTGTGKTLAYLAPAIMHRRRLLVSTGTRALQDQIFHKDIPLLAAVLDRPIQAAYLKGRNNYLCKTKLDTFSREGLFTPAELEAFDEIREWAGGTETGDRAELPAAADDEALWARLDARRERCTGTRCEEFERCFLTRVRRRAIESDIVVVNHHLFFADLAIRESEMAQILPDYTAVIFDEAHELEDVATAYFGFRVSNFRVQDLTTDVRAWGEASQTPVDRLLAPLLRASEAFFGPFLAMPEGRHPLPEPEGIGDLIDALLGFRRGLKALSDAAGEREPLLARVAELASELRVFGDGDMENYVSWLDRRGRGVFLETCPVDVAPLLSEALFERVPTCILTSATLSVAGSTDYLQARLGLNDAVTATLATEFDFSAQAALYIPRELPEYRAAEYTPRAAEEIERLLEISSGRAFVLFTSYRQMQACYELLRRRLRFPTLIQGRTSRTRLLAEFRETPQSVLFATSSFWQGVDVPGDSLSCVIIDKLPFQVPSDPLVQARIRRIEQSGGNPFSEYQVPAAILRLKQGFGRLIRSKSDRGMLAILDSRLRTRGYGQTFLSSLPDYTLVESLGELRAFMDGGNGRQSREVSV